MALDGLVLRALIHELQPLVGGRVHRIHQPFDRDLMLHIRNRGKTERLLVSANPTYPRLHLTEQKFENPLEPPMFCMIMRKYCENGIIESIEQIGLERIVHVNIRQRDELGDLSIKTVVIEMMGRHSNIMLVDQQSGQILDGIHHVTPAVSSYRLVRPGVNYVAPPDQGKQNPLQITTEEWPNVEKQLMSEFTHEPNHTELARALVHTFNGISPLNAKEIVHRGYPQFIPMMNDIREHRYEPNIRNKTDGKTVYSVFKLTHVDGKERPFTSIHDCLEHYYHEKTMKDLITQRVGNLYRWIQNERKKNENKLNKLQKTLASAENCDHLRVMGELLTASLHLIKRGDEEATVDNYYDEDGGTMQIPLDPRLSPADNAQRYFRRYAKSKNSIDIVREQITETELEIRYLATLAQQLNNADLTDVDEIRDELIEQGYIRQRRKRTPKKKNNKPRLHQFTSSEGIPIYVGKNNLQNDYLTNRFARPDETWLHTKEIPGSHVVIKAQEFGERTLEEGAMLAAYYSQARESSQVPVDYTLIRHVRKPNGAKPGFVIYENEKTLFITPDEQRIMELNSTK